jgi:hypothetical protein
MLLYVEKLTDGRTDRQRDRRTDMALIGEFFDYVNAPKIVNNNDAS